MGEPLETPDCTQSPCTRPVIAWAPLRLLVTDRRNGERLLYTGDLRIQPSPINEPAEAIPCDTLVIESTYGRPDYVFPPQEEAIATALRRRRLNGSTRAPSRWCWAGGWARPRKPCTTCSPPASRWRARKACTRSPLATSQPASRSPEPIGPSTAIFNDGEVLLFPPGRKSRESITQHIARRDVPRATWNSPDGPPARASNPGDAAAPAIPASLQRPRRLQRPGGLRSRRTAPARVHRLRFPRPGRPPASNWATRQPTWARTPPPPTRSCRCPCSNRRRTKRKGRFQTCPHALFSSARIT